MQIKDMGKKKVKVMMCMTKELDREFIKKYAMMSDIFIHVTFLLIFVISTVVILPVFSKE